MTVFDSLRFPNPNIFSHAELMQLPRPLLESWVEKCLIGISYPGDLNLSDPRNDFGIVLQKIAEIKARKYSFGIEATERALVSAYSREFTNLLKKMLGEYDT